MAKRDFRYQRKEKRKMTSRKTTGSLLAMTLLSTFALAYFPLTATASPATLVWLTHWTEPGETAFWDAVIAKYEADHPDVDIQRDAVEFDALYQTIMMRHAAGEDPDIIHQHAMWVPTFANWRTHILAIPDPIVQQDIKDNWKPSTVEGTTYNSIVWGYPTEFNSWALVYDREVFNRRIAELSLPDKATLKGVLDMLEADTPLSYKNLTDAAKLLTKWSTSITQTGFCPFIEGMPEEQRFQFLSLLSSNGGDYVDLAVPEAVFDSTSGYEVMQLYHDLGYVIDTDTTLPGLQPVYDPLNIPDYWWQAWIDETIGMIILPTWMTYVRDAMDVNFDHLGIAPIPIGPSGTESKSMTYNWVNTVSQRAVDKADGTAEAAWAFLQWLNSPKTSGSVATVDGRPIPLGQDVSVMGDFLIYDSIVPSRKSDITNGKVGKTAPGVPLTDDFWFSDFIKFGSPPYGKGDRYFLKGEQAQYQIGLMFERVTLLGEDPITAVNDVADAIGDLAPPNPDILTMAGDVNINGVVEVSDAVSLIVDWGATPAVPKWNRGRSEIYADIPPVIDISDATILSVNYGKVGGSI